MCLRLGSQETVCTFPPVQHPPEIEQQVADAVEALTDSGMITGQDVHTFGYKLQLPGDAGIIDICFAESLEGEQPAEFDPSIGHVVINLQYFTGIGATPGAKQRAKNRGILIHESNHLANWKEVIQPWKQAVCAGLEEEALDECHECMDAVIKCHWDDGSCLQFSALLAQLNQLCDELAEPGLTPEDASALGELKDEVCERAGKTKANCESVDCPNDCGNMMPFPSLDPSALNPGCECVL